MTSSKFEKRMLYPPLAMALLVVAAPFEALACDTWVALKDATSGGFTIFAKNSDRIQFDSQPLLFYPGRNWPAESTVNLGRLSIPQVDETYATMGSSPYWCWGYEEGINEFGVSIGNEGIWTRVLSEQIEASEKGKGPKPGPTGMDLVRLGLERGKTARQALDVITDLVERYGQFGSGLPTMGLDGAYENSYIIADPNEAWVLETAGTHWIARKFTSGSTSISNTLSIGDDWDLSSSDIVSHALEKGWWEKDNTDAFHFTAAYLVDSPEQRARAGRALTRQDCSRRLLLEKEGQIDPRWMMRIARDRSSVPSIDLDQTASSCVAVLPDLPDTLPVFWWCPSVPSNCCYVPFFVHGSHLPEMVSAAGTYGKRVVDPSRAGVDSFSSDSYWWLFRDLSDRVRIDWEKRNPVVRAAFDELEIAFAAGLPEVMNRAVALRKEGKRDDAAGVLDAYTAACFEQAVHKVNELRGHFEEQDEDGLAKAREEARPREEIILEPAILDIYVGKYQRPRPDSFLEITRKGNKLYAQGTGEPKFLLAAESVDTFFHETVQARLTFVKNEEGQVTHILVNQLGTKLHLRNCALAWPEPPKERKEINVDPAIYDAYVGTYTLTANRTCTITKEGDDIHIQVSGQPKLEMFPESETKFFLKVVDAQIEFVVDKTGAVTHFLQYQGPVILQADRRRE
jgi:secernin